MSNLLLQHSEPSNLDIWQELSGFADALSANFSFYSLFSYASGFIERVLHCSAKVWLNPEIISQVDYERLKEMSILIDSRTSLMDEALQARKIFVYDSPQTAGTTGTRLIVAIPILVKEQVVGVWQLEQIDPNEGLNPGIELFTTFASLLSTGILSLLEKTAQEFQLLCDEFSTKTAEIGKSVLSNLDRGSLNNNLLTLLHQYIGYSRATLLLIRSDDQASVKCIDLFDGKISESIIKLNNEADHSLAWSINHGLPDISTNLELNLSQSGLHGNNIAETYCVLPLMDGETVIGALRISDTRQDLFGLETINGLFLLIKDISTAVSNANTFYSERLRRIINDRFREVLGVISADISFEELLEKILFELESFITYDVSAIWLFDDNESINDGYRTALHLASVRISKNFKRSIEANSRINENQMLEIYYDRMDGEANLFSDYPWIKDVATSGYPITRDEDNISEPLGEMIGLEGQYSAIGTTLVVGGQPVGILVLADRKYDHFDLDSKWILYAFANAASVTITNSKLYSAAHSQVWISTVLLQVAEATQSITDLDELLDTVAKMVPDLLGIRACEIFIWDPTIETFLPFASSGFDEEQEARLKLLDVYPGLIPAFDDLVRDEKPIILNKEAVSTEISAQYFPGYDFSNDLLILFPIAAQNNLGGALMVDFAGSDLRINSSQKIWDDTYLLIDGINRQVAAAIENLQLIKTQEEEAYISIAMLQVTQAIVSYTDISEILSSIVRITPILVGVKRCIIYLWDYKNSLFHQSESYGFTKFELSQMGSEIKANEFPFLAAVQQEMKILYHPLGLRHSPDTWNEISQENTTVVESLAPSDNGEVSIKLDSKSLIRMEKLLLGFPLSIKDEFLGVMLVEEEDQAKKAASIHVREKRIEIVQGISQQTAVAIKNEQLQQEAVKSERMEQELQLAREIQTTFLPKELPHIPGWSIAARWIPARQVAGDFYDVLTLSDDRIGVVIADVADKGMPAALFMTLIRTLIRAAAKEEISPARVLKQVNDLLVPDSKNSLFVTVFYGVISLNSGKLVYANAGHNPPIIKRSTDHDIIELAPTGVALGIFNDISISEKEQTIHPGDWILLYTDGITEAFSYNGEMFGKERLFSLLQEFSSSSPAELIQAIERSILEFTKGSDLSDDVTMTVLNRNLTDF